MESDKKFKNRFTTWQVVLRPDSVKLLQDGKGVTSMSPRYLSEVAHYFAGKVERTINAMKDNSVQSITFHLRWQ